MTKVSVLKCDEYKLTNLMKVVQSSLDNIIDCQALFTQGKRVLLKVNAVSPQNGNLGYTTNPLFLQAVIRVLKQYPVTIIVGDNPPFRDMKQVLAGNGMLQVIKEENALLCNNTHIKTITNQQALVFPVFEVSQEMVEVDILINLPKLKTHSLTYYSGAQKNLFGLIYGLAKANWHVRASEPDLFATMINDLYLAAKQQFKPNHFIHLMDAIDVLEGEGPTTGGTKRHLGYVLSSTSAVALDRIALDLAGLDYKKSVVTQKAAYYKIETTDLDKITIVGDKTLNKDIKLKEPKKTIGGIKLTQKRWVRNLVLEIPIIDKNLCIKCGECTKICPPGTLKIEHKNFPKLKKASCIRCWCCSEVCPVAAIEKSKRPLIGRLAFKYFEKKGKSGQ